MTDNERPFAMKHRKVMNEIQNPGPYKDCEESYLLGHLVVSAVHG